MNQERDQALADLEKAEARAEQLQKDLDEIAESLQAESDENFARAERYAEALEWIRDYDPSFVQGIVGGFGAHKNIARSALSPPSGQKD